MPVAAERPAFSLSPAYSVAAVRPSILTLSPFPFSYAHGRYALTGRSCIAYLVALASRDHGLLRVTCHRFAYSFSPVSRATGSLISNMPRLSLRHRRHDDVVRLCLLRLSRTSLRPMLPEPSRFAGSRYAQFSTRFVSPLSLIRLDVISVSHLYGLCARLYLYLPYMYIYWVGDGTIPIFNLLCNHPSVVT